MKPTTLALVPVKKELPTIGSLPVGTVFRNLFKDGLGGLYMKFGIHPSFGDLFKDRASNRYRSPFIYLSGPNYGLMDFDNIDQRVEVIGVLKEGFEPEF